jgi:hypothetical protein
MTTLNPANAGPNVTLGGGNLQVTGNSPVADSGAQSTTSQASANSYIEAFFVGLGPDTGFGFANTINYPNIGATSALATTIFPTSGNIWFNGAATGLSVGVGHDNDVYAAAINFSSKLIWYKNVTTASNWNGTVGASPGGTGGISFSALTGPFFMFFVISAGTTNFGQVNFGATAFTGALPSGFVAWDSVGSLLMPQVLM